MTSIIDEFADLHGVAPEVITDSLIISLIVRVLSRERDELERLFEGVLCQRDELVKKKGDPELIERLDNYAEVIDSIGRMRFRPDWDEIDEDELSPPPDEGKAH